MSPDTKARTESGLSTPLAWATRRIVRHPRLVLAASVLLAFFSALITVQFLDFHTSRLDLLNPDDEFNQRWLAYLDEFGDEDDAVIVVEAGPGATREEVVAAIDDLAARIESDDEHFHSVLYRQNFASLESKGLHYASDEELARLEAFLVRLDASAEQSPPALDQEEADRLLTGLEAALGEEFQYASPWPEATVPTPAQETYLLADEGRLGVILLRIHQDESRFDSGTDAIERLRALIDESRSGHPAVSFGLTGMPVLENDEMRTSQGDMMRASLLSLLGVSLLFIIGFGGIRHPLLTVVSLLLAMAWSFGYITLAVGHLNILSVSFGVILIGLGIDFGIHYVARYLALRRTIDDAGEALAQTAASVGPGIVTGGLTTALAFCTAALTKFTGIAELGLIAGGGIVLCIVAALFVLPALVFLADRRQKGRRAPAPIPFGAMLRPLFARPRYVLLSGLALVALVSLGAVRLRYDHNLLNLQAKGIESVEAEEKLIQRSGRSVWFALSMADTSEEAAQRKSELLRLDSVDRVETLADMFPSAGEERSVAVARIGLRLDRLDPGDARVGLGNEELAMLVAQLAHGGNGPAAPRAAAIERRLAQLPAEEQARRLELYQQNVAADLEARLRDIRDAADPAPPEAADLPPAVQTRFVGRTGRHLLRVYPKGDIWDMDALRRFVADVERVDPQVTGHPVQTYHASRQMQQSYVHASFYSLIAVLIVLIVDFRSIWHSLLAILPMGLGMLMMFGVMGIFDIPLNPANMIVLPLILGIGIDDGVHVVHDFRRQSGRYRLSNSTAAAVLITSATTIAGFGSMMLVAQHQGLQSLGQVLTIGVLCCLLTSVLILPALLAWLTRVRKDTDKSEPGENDDQPATLPFRSREPEQELAGSTLRAECNDPVLPLRQAAG